VGAPVPFSVAQGQQNPFFSATWMPRVVWFFTGLLCILAAITRAEGRPAYRNLRYRDTTTDNVSLYLIWEGNNGTEFNATWETTIESLKQQIASIVHIPATSQQLSTGSPEVHSIFY